MLYASAMVTAENIGASGYAGTELLRLLAGHPDIDVRYVTADSAAGGRLADVVPALAAAYPALVLERYDLDAAAGLDVVFTSVPSGATGSIVPDLLPKVGYLSEADQKMVARAHDVAKQAHGTQARRIVSRPSRSS